MRLNGSKAEKPPVFIAFYTPFRFDCAREGQLRYAFAFFRITMIGTIRKHSKWLLWLIAGATIFSFVYFMGQGPGRGGGGGTVSINTNLIGGQIYGQAVTPERYDQMEKDVNLFFLFNYGEWANKNPNLTQDALLQIIYQRMMLLQK